MLGDRRRKKAVAEHGASLERFLTAIRDLDAEAWEAPRVPGSWSPADVTQHLILCYEVALREMKGDGDEAISRRAGPVWSTILRWLLLPHILFHRTMPRSRAVGEVRPRSHPGDPKRGIRRMEELASELDRGLLHHPDSLRSVRHPYFGRISAYQFVRLTAVHLDHHRAQVEQRIGGRR